jgi:hypothetical protein
MKCPNCGSVMNSARPAGGKPSENICPNCGLKKPSRNEMKAESFPEFDLGSFESSELPEPSRPSSSKAKKNTSTSKVKKRTEKAKYATELRQISRELTSRLGDLEIQISRRIEELQALSVRLEQFIETYED